MGAGKSVETSRLTPGFARTSSCPPPLPTFLGPDFKPLSHPTRKVKNGSRPPARTPVSGAPAEARSPTMGSKIYVGNLSYDATSSDLEQMFSAHGSVQS